MRSVVTLSGVLIGPRAATLLDGAVTGRLLASFHDACYLQMGSDAYLLLCARRYGGISFAIAVDDPQQFLALDIQPGTPFFAAPSALLFPNTAVRVEGQLWKPSPLPLCPARFPAPALQGLADLLLGAQRGVARDLLRPAPGNVYAAAAREPAARLADACRRHAVSAEAEDCLVRLIGLGPGLTPSMDDWLFGFLYTLRLLPGFSGEAEALSRLVMRLAPSRTTFAGAAYLGAAARGERMELADRVLSALFAGDIPSLLSATGAMLQVGSNSGSDMLTGMLFAARLHAPPLPAL